LLVLGEGQDWRDEVISSLACWSWLFNLGLLVLACWFWLAGFGLLVLAEAVATENAIAEVAGASYC